MNLNLYFYSMSDSTTEIDLLRATLASAGETRSIRFIIATLEIEKV